MGWTKSFMLVALVAYAQITVAADAQVRTLPVQRDQQRTRPSTEPFLCQRTNQSRHTTPLILK